ncbi:MAG: hypothetical protein ACRDNG_10875 [Gaiellaceae bacterium]
MTTAITAAPRIVTSVRYQPGEDPRRDPDEGDEPRRPSEGDVADDVPVLGDDPACVRVGDR